MRWRVEFGRRVVYTRRPTRELTSFNSGGTTTREHDSEAHGGGDVWFWGSFWKKKTTRIRHGHLQARGPVTEMLLSTEGRRWGDFGGHRYLYMRLCLGRRKLDSDTDEIAREGGAIMDAAAGWRGNRARETKDGEGHR
jgi:hypothetical protein